MGGQRAESYYEASLGDGLRDAPTHPPRCPIKSVGSSPQSSDSAQERRGFPSSNQEASGRGRNPSDLARRVEWLSGPEYQSGGEQSSWPIASGLAPWLGLVVVCGPSRWLIVVVEAEQPGSWACGFRNMGSSPTVVVEVRCDRTRWEGTRPGSGPPAELSSSAGGPNKDPRGPFLLGVCVFVRGPRL